MLIINSKLKAQNLKLFYNCFILTFFWLFFVPFPFFVKAKVELGVAPQKLDLVILPGDIYKGQFKIANFSEISLPLSIKIVPFGAEDETGKTIFQETTPGSPVFWFEFDKKEMILEPGKTKRINFQIKIPKDVNPGGYYVFVYFEPRYPPDYLMKIGPKIVPMVAVPVLISTTPLTLEPEAGKEFEVVEFSVLERERAKNLEKTLYFISKGLAVIGSVEAAKNSEITITKTKPSFFNVKIKNNDIYQIKPFGKLSLYNVFGKEIAKADFSGQTILPGKTMLFQIKVEDKNQQGFQIPLSDLKLKAEVNLRAQSPVRGEIFLKEKVPVLSFFSLFSMYFLIGFAIILVMGLLFKKRLKTALLALVGKYEKL